MRSDKFQRLFFYAAKGKVMQEDFLMITEILIGQF
jgi:hypothetical protein